MIAYEWRVDFYSGGAWRTLGNIQNINIFRGRRLQIDDYGADTLTLECRSPSTWTYTPKLGDKIVAYVYRPGVVVGVDKYPGFIGTIRDVDINYGKIPSLDTVTILGEGIQADWGRAQLNGLVLAQDKTDEQVLDAATAAGLGVAQYGAMSTASGQTYTGNALELINALVRTEEARIYAVPYQSNISWPGTWLLYYRGRGSNIDLNTKWLFNDGTVTANTYDNKYDNIVFRSSADNYYNQVTIQPEFVAAQTATLSATPIFSWAKTTIDYSTGQAADHANWLLNNFQTKDSTVAAISFTEVEQNDKLPNPFTTENPQPLMMIDGAISAGVTIGFRGTTYNCVCEGISITGTPQQTRITLYLSGQDTNAYLILDDATYGKLNSNKLGF